MRIGGVRTNNCRLDAPGYGSFEVPVVTLGYGLQINATTGESRRSRTFYPYQKVPGMWYIEVAFSDVTQRNDFHNWLISYIMQITDQWSDKSLAPISVIIASASFIRTGYPTSSIQLGDAMGTGVYKSVVQFQSAVDPLLSSASGSKYAPPLRDDTARKFYPADDQSHTLPDPIWPSTALGVDAVWKTGTGNPIVVKRSGGGGKRK